MCLVILLYLSQLEEEREVWWLLRYKEETGAATSEQLVAAREAADSQARLTRASAAEEKEGAEVSITHIKLSN